MKQVLLQANDTYLFPLPQTYISLVKETCNKLKISEHHFILYHEGTVVNKDNFKNINDDLNILDVSIKLNGGGDFPNVTKLVGIGAFSSGLIVVVLLSLLSLILVVTTYIVESPKEREKGILETFDSINYVPIWKTLTANDVSREILFLGIVVYIFSTIPVFSILLLRSRQCPTFKPPWSKLLLISIAPYVLWIILCISIKSDTGKDADNTPLYLFTGGVFIAVGAIITTISNNSLKEWSHEDTSIDLYAIPVSATIGYSLMRFFSLFGNTKSSFISGLMYIGLTFIATTAAAAPFYIDAYMKYTSSLVQGCAQTT
jgi:hypothetical protein